MCVAFFLLVLSLILGFTTKVEIFFWIAAAICAVEFITLIRGSESGSSSPFD